MKRRGTRPTDTGSPRRRRGSTPVRTTRSRVRLTRAHTNTHSSDHTRPVKQSVQAFNVNVPPMFAIYIYIYGVPFSFLFTFFLFASRFPLVLPDVPIWCSHILLRDHAHYTLQRALSVLFPIKLWTKNGSRSSDCLQSIVAFVCFVRLFEQSRKQARNIYSWSESSRFTSRHE